MVFLKNKIAKKIILAVIFILLGCLLIWFLIYYYAVKPPYSPLDLPEPYRSLADNCLISNNTINPYDNCCLASLRASMRQEVDVLTIVPYNKQIPDCSDGFFPNGLLCLMSFRWCEKSQ